MRLSRIKLSGFKTFVDPTTFNVSADLTGIVGPNGCGKSNIIDALLWVMGESSAKHLRGDLLADVIFNGSGGRQPVGQATVELIFENNLGRLAAQYASWSEVSIKRQISRDGISSYYLNGTRCRRRDITSLFLGTGLGARRYAIIEQDTIARLIEAKPEELRAHIEEAAGISKYRERRKEATHRIRHAQDNINRINDIRLEIEKQLESLQRQVKAAERFQKLKQDERRLRSEGLALAWRELRRAAEQAEADERARETAVDAAQAELRAVEAQIEQGREELDQANQKLNECQTDYYQTDSDISSSEQALQHVRQRISELERELLKTGEQFAQTSEEQQQDEQQMSALGCEIDALEPKLQQAQLGSEQAGRLLSDAEAAWQGWQTEWDAHRHSEAELEAQRQRARTRLEYLQEELQENARQRETMQAELDTLADSGLPQKLSEQHDAHQRLEAELEQCRKDSESAASAVEQERQSLLGFNTELDEARTRQQMLKGQLSSLETLQAEQLGRQDPALQQWLEAQRLGDCRRLAECVEVEADWMSAFETVVASSLEHLCVEDVQALLDGATLPALGTGFISAPGALPESGKQSGKWPRLLDKVQNEPPPMPEWLGSVYTADSLAQAMSRRAELLPHESVVTAEGVWLGRNWVIISPAEQGAGALRREQSIRQLRGELQDAAETLESLGSAEQAASSRLQQAEEKRASLQADSQQIQTRQAEVAVCLAEARERIAQNDLNGRRIEQELDTLWQRAQQCEQDVALLERELTVFDEDHQALQTRHEELSASRVQHGESLQQARSNWQSSHQANSGVALQVETLKSRRAVLGQARQRIALQMQHLQHRREELQSNLEQSREPLPDMKKALEEQLQAKANAERALSGARDALESSQTRVRELDQARLRCEQSGRAVEEALQQARVESNGCRVRLETVLERLSELGDADAEALAASLDESATQVQWEEKLAAVTHRISRLGGVNLAAIDEFKHLQERQGYLNSQHDDLCRALNILENAIGKIDRESQNRFKQTFDGLNNNLSDTFTRLFGGGFARLELSSNDLLETGVTISARPPGKRNSTVQLLSGGEKALLAIALVFAIFKLNPAPFCILDEVDAPLDDSNASRFSEMLVNMSGEIQFLFITHNKITMEIAHKLIGVTMQEAGVSRLVTVDMEQATQLAVNA